MILVRAAALALIPCVVGAQTGHVTGSVIDKVAGVALPFSGVSVVEQSFDRLTSDSGIFQLDVPAGTIRLRIRHVGFTPVDTQLVVRANDTTRVRIELARIPVTLAAMRVTDEVCRSPGAPTASDALAQVFQQLQLNAEQFRLVSTRYPFTSIVERRFSHLVQEPKPRQKSDSAGSLADTVEVVTKTDSIEVPSDQKWHYKPGDIIVVSGVSVLGVRYAVMIPTLAVFADAEFVKHHCFHDAGEATVDGQPLRRVDFKAAEDIRDPDIDGTMYLDPTTYVIRRSVISLSKKSPRYASSYDSVVVETTFDELVSGVPVITWTSGRNALSQGASRPSRASNLPDGSRLIDDEESQRVREIRFVHDAPGAGDESNQSRRAPRVVRLDGPIGHHRVMGVFDAESGNPVAGAAVRDSLTGKSALTTATGTVSLAFVPRSTAVIQIEHAGYERASMPVSLTLIDTLPLTIVLRRSRVPR